MAADDEQKTSPEGHSTARQPASNDPHAADRVGATRVSTSDPAASSPAELRGPPEQVVSYQTSHVPAPSSDYRVKSGGDVVRENASESSSSAGSRTAEAVPAKDERPRQDQPRGEHQSKRAGGQQNGKRLQHHRRHDHEADEDRRHRATNEHRPTAAGAANRPSWTSMMVTAAVGLVFGIGGAWAYSSFFGSAADKQEQSSDKSAQASKGGDKSGSKSGNAKSKGGKSEGSEGGDTMASASEIPGFTSAHDAETFKKELEHLAHRLDLVSGRIDRLTTNEDKTPPVLHTMQTKMTGLERDLNDVAQLPSKIDQIERSVSDLKQEFQTLKNQVAGSEVPIGSELASPDAFSGERSHGNSSADPADEATLRLAMGLLREGHASQSYEVLRRLQRERPKDARVWYLSALAKGLSTGDWDGKTRQLAQQGLACERAGHPSHSAIDEALSGLGPDAGKDWIASQRREVKSR